MGRCRRVEEKCPILPRALLEAAYELPVAEGEDLRNRLARCMPPDITARWWSMRV